MKQESINSNQLTEFDSILAESINNSKLKEGTIIKGIIAEIEDDAVIVDIGAKVEGRIPKREFAFRKDLLNDMRVPSDWGLEMGVASEMYRNNSTNRICQVELTDNYDHKHQELSANDAGQGLSRMSLDITKSLIRKLAIQGTVFNQETFRTLKATYYRVALDYVESFRRDAIMNGLDFDTHAEEQAVELFATNILEAGKQFLERPLDAPFMPTWSRVVSAVPDIFEQLIDAVEEDHREFSSRGL